MLEADIATLKNHIYYFDTLPSTQTYALSALKDNTYKPPFCIYAAHQSHAIGSRGNQWESVKRAMAFSFALSCESLPRDLKIESSSIFFGVIMQQFLASLGSQVWLKYPNDLYIKKRKMGGILTQKVKNALICGIGINLSSPQPSKYGSLEDLISANLKPQTFLNDFFESFKNFHSWKQIFSIYKLEFHKNKSYFFHFHQQRICLKDATLNEDGSLNINGENFYSLR
ncbi:biotin--[acetyl-CoA-carboxylase] ligase [Helicobacter jaachi]|uniref:Biotin--[acetyl-CoA-carboxylase] ligase n=1 Tax=Helicobacter jaachi TaxID=1677920 RepID=A0A4U8T8Q5_9HELI|nr:biotin--[acetyl-CoA-carboxylase] ligase [Helicobacter jaachi]TLD96025.1 biotin--[acetyl-CoA-carboxylase] ligase [Helicobacter jaachi]